MDDIFSGGGDDVGLMSCTESLGFESSDERINMVQESFCCTTSFSNNNDNNKMMMMVRKEVVAMDKKKFPPPLSSLSQDGRPTFYLRPVRGNGRLMLTEVKIVRPEILRASRQDGRLKLHLVQDETDDDDYDDDDDDDDDDEEIEMPDEDLTNEHQFSGTTACVGGVGGDGLRRCYEQASHHHQHVWRQQCVTIR